MFHNANRQFLFNIIENFHNGCYTDRFCIETIFILFNWCEWMRRCERFMSSVKWLRSGRMYSFRARVWCWYGIFIMWFNDHIDCFECKVKSVSLSFCVADVAAKSIEHKFNSSIAIKGNWKWLEKTCFFSFLFHAFHRTIVIFRRVINASMCRKSVETSFMHHSILVHCHRFTANSKWRWIFFFAQKSFSKSSERGKYKR